MNVDLTPVNFTLVIQLGNFLISYILIEKLLFGPVVGLLAHDQAVLDQLSDEYRLIQKELTTAEENKQKTWQEAQQQFALGVPRVEQSVALPLQDVVSVPDFSAGQIEEVSEKVYKSLRERMSHA